MFPPIFQRACRNAATATLILASGLGAVGCGQGRSTDAPPVRSGTTPLPAPALAPAPAERREAPPPVVAGPTTITPMPKMVPERAPDAGAGVDGDADAGGGTATSADAGPAGAVATVRRYYAALDRRGYDTAYRLWENDGQASGQTLPAFRQGFAHTSGTRVTPGSPGRVEGAAGSSYVTVPVTVEATLDDGTRQRFTGSYVLRRVNDVPGSDAPARRWHLHSADLKPA